MAYLVKNPPARTQFRHPRRAKPSGLIVVHTAENAMDTVGEDTGAENVAAFIARRTDAPGSYHILADSDSRLRLVPFTAEAYGDGTGSNPYAMHLSAACRTTDWKKMSAARRAGFVNQMARGAATYAKWLKKNYGIDIPSRRVTRSESSAGKAGFITHGERDPGRRTDPGADFPWDEFFEAFDKRMGRSTVKPKRQMPNVQRFLNAKTRKARVNALKKITGKRAKKHARQWLNADNVQRAAGKTKRNARKALAKIARG